MEQIIGALRNEKISAGVLVALIGIAWWAYSWSEDRFVNQDEFSTLQRTVNEGFESIEINDAGQVIRDIKLEITIVKAAQGTQAEIDHLNEELEHAKAYKECLVKQGPNCQHLKEVE
jgi:hypothetical protein